MGLHEAVVLAVAELLVAGLPLVIDVADLVVLGLVDADLVSVEVRIGVSREAREAVHVRAALTTFASRQAEVTEEMVERAVLHHDDDELLVAAEDLPLLGDRIGALVELLFFRGLARATRGQHAGSESQSLQRTTTRK